ncbi:MAG: TetR/AcrR family transcriptional regulator [Bacteroidaceae bacterium]|nr:TetR/AcrR family transcriptional regulator [Bacteroidaceae bacterium]
MTSGNTLLRRNDPQYRHSIITHAISQFHQKGIKGVTMSQISEDLRISKRTLYEIYDSKEALLLDCLKEKQRVRRELMETHIAQTNNVLEAILKIFRMQLDESHHINPVFIEQLQSYKAARNFFIELHEKQREEAVAFLNKGIEEGVFHEQANFEIIYDMCAAIVENIFSLKLLDRLPTQEVFKATMLCYIRGFTTPKGQQIIDSWLQKVE